MQRRHATQPCQIRDRRIIPLSDTAKNITHPNLIPFHPEESIKPRLPSQRKRGFLLLPSKTQITQQIMARTLILRCSSHTLLRYLSFYRTAIV